MEVTNPVFQSADDEKPPVYEYRSLGRSLDGVTSSNYPVTQPLAPLPPPPKEPKAPQSMKCFLALVCMATVVNFLLILGAGGVLYYYHLKFNDLDEQISPIVGAGSLSSNRNVTGPPGPQGLQGNNCITVEPVYNGDQHVVGDIKGI